MAGALPIHAQGLQSGTGMQPSQTLDTPPGTPAIDQPGALHRALARKQAARAKATAAKPARSSEAASPR